MFDADYISFMAIFTASMVPIVVHNSTSWKNFIEFSLGCSLFLFVIHLADSRHIILSTWDSYGFSRTIPKIVLPFSLFFTAILLFSFPFYVKRLRREESAAREQEAWRRQEQAKRAQEAEELKRWQKAQERREDNLGETRGEDDEVKRIVAGLIEAAKARKDVQ